MTSLFPAAKAYGMICAITTLTLHHFRNYESASLEVSPAPVVLTGHNGAGKTNLLEAISLLSPGRGFRRPQLSELSLNGQPWVVAAHVLRGQQEVHIGTGLDVAEGLSDKRLVKIDGRPAKSHTELAEYTGVIWLTPQMDQLFQEGGTARRKFIDRLVFHFDTAHAGRVNAYDTAMRDRNRVLSEPRPDPLWLDALEAKMAELGAAISIARAETALHINAMMEQSTTPFPKGKIILSGLVEAALEEGLPALQIEQRYREALAANRREDASAGRTLLGAHRTQVEVIYLDKNVPVDRCSTGEQKAMLLSIVLAEARAGQHWRGLTPIVLLDEVVAHLDESRRHALFTEILALGAQAWLTGTDASLFAELLPHAQHRQIEAGRVALSK